MLKLMTKQGWQDAQLFRDRSLHTYIHEIAKYGGYLMFIGPCIIVIVEE
jgi:hypothetical protein